MAMPAPGRSPLQPAGPLGSEEFMLKDLSWLTNGFMEEAKIGSGSFGLVYRAKLADGWEVAIKRTEHASSDAQWQQQFDSEHAFQVELNYSVIRRSSLVASNLKLEQVDASKLQ